MTKLIADLLGHLDRSSRRHLVVAALVACLLAPIEVIGVGLVVPLLDLVAGQTDVESGPVGVVSDLTGVRDPETLALILGGAVVVLFAIRAVATVVLRWWVLGVIASAERDVAVRLLRGYLSEPYGQHLNRNSAEVLRTLHNSVAETFGGLIAAAFGAVAEVVVAVSLFALLLVVEPLATLVLVGYFALAIPFYVVNVQRRAYTLGGTMQQLSQRGIFVARDSLDAVKELQVLGVQEEYVNRFASVRGEMAESRRTVQFLREAPRYIVEVVFLAGVGLLLAALAMSRGGESAIPTLGVFVAAGFRLMPPVGRLMSSQTGMRSSAAAAEIVCGELHRLEAGSATIEGPRTSSLSAADFHGEPLVFDRVGFVYVGSDEPVLRDVSFSIAPGESVALVGASGAGKTTVVDLALGLHVPTSGAIRLGDHDLGRILPAWRQQVGYVPQDVFLFDASLRENIALGVPAQEIDEGRLHAAVEVAQLKDVVEALEQGLRTEVGERGARLSGGQRQRIGIARALYRHPRFLILDEATSALDVETEARVITALSQLDDRMSVMAITHRVASLYAFDRVLHLASGLVIADGPMTELFAELPSFAPSISEASSTDPQWSASRGESSSG